MLDNYRDLVDELLGTPTALRELVGERLGDDVPPPALALMRELLDRDRTVLRRLQTVLREPNPYLRALGAPESAPSPPVEAVEPSDLLGAVDSARGDLVSLLMNLTLKDWERTATHEVDGEITVAEEVERHVEFDEDHVARIQATLGRPG